MSDSNLRKAIKELIRAHDKEFQNKGLASALWSAVDTFRDMLGEPEQEPVWYLHIMDNTEGIPENKPYERATKDSNHNFGVAGEDYDESFPVSTIPLYTKPQQEKEVIGYIEHDERIKITNVSVKIQPLRRLSDDEIADIYYKLWIKNNHNEYTLSNAIMDAIEKLNQ